MRSAVVANAAVTASGGAPSVAFALTIDAWTILSVLSTALVLGMIATLLGLRVGGRDPDGAESAERDISGVLARRTLRAGTILPDDVPPETDQAAGDAARGRRR